MTFGEHVATLLELRGWSQGLLAKKAQQAQITFGIDTQTCVLV